MKFVSDTKNVPCDAMQLRGGAKVCSDGCLTAPESYQTNNFEEGNFWLMQAVEGHSCYMVSDPERVGPASSDAIILEKMGIPYVIVSFAISTRSLRD